MLVFLFIILNYNFICFGFFFQCNNLEKSSDLKRNLPFWLNTFVKINKIACNNNEMAHKLIAVGYENGLVRIIHI